MKTTSLKEIVFGSIMLAIMFGGGVLLTYIGKTFVTKAPSEIRDSTTSISTSGFKSPTQQVPQGNQKILPLIFYSDQNQLNTKVAISSFSSDTIKMIPTIFNPAGDFHVYKEITVNPGTDYIIDLANLANKPSGLDQGGFMSFTVNNNPAINISYEIISAGESIKQLFFVPKTRADIIFDIEGERANHISITNFNPKSTEVSFYTINELGMVEKEISKTNLDPYETKIMSLKDLFGNQEIKDFKANSPKESLFATTFYKDPKLGDRITNISIK